MTEIDKLRRRLQEVKTIEERRLIQEALLNYVNYLHDLYVRCIESIRKLTYAITVLVPLNALFLVVSLLRDSLSRISILAIYTLVIVILGLILLMVIEDLNAKTIEREIRDLYNIMTDPTMPRLRIWPYIAYGITMLIITIIIAIIATLKII